MEGVTRGCARKGWSEEKVAVPEGVVRIRNRCSQGRVQLGDGAVQ